eukprot:COSAG01_NODE_172_length_23108_cov_26.690496_14_plen_152_part_00
METTSRNWHEGVISIPSPAFAAFAEGDGAMLHSLLTHGSLVTRVRDQWVGADRGSYVVLFQTMRGEYWDVNRALLRPRNVYPIILLHPHVTPKTSMVTYVPEEVSTAAVLASVQLSPSRIHACCHSISLLLLLASHSPLCLLLCLDSAILS